MTDTCLEGLKCYGNLNKDVITDVDVYYKIKLNLMHMLEMRGYQIPENEARIEYEPCSDCVKAYNTQGSYIPCKTAMKYTEVMANCTTVQDYRHASKAYNERMKIFTDFYRNIQIARKSSFATNLNARYQHLTTGKYIHVMFTDNIGHAATPGERFSTALANLIGPDYQNMAGTHIIMVVENAIATKDLDTLRQASFNVEIFTYQQLLVDPLKHNFNSKYRFLTPDQSKSFYKNNNLKPSQVPFFTANDPVIRFNGRQPGDLCLIMRHNTFTEGVPTSVTYRNVTKTVLGK